MLAVGGHCGPGAEFSPSLLSPSKCHLGAGAALGDPHPVSTQQQPAWGRAGCALATPGGHSWSLWPPAMSDQAVLGSPPAALNTVTEPHCGLVCVPQTQGDPGCVRSRLSVVVSWHVFAVLEEQGPHRTRRNTARHGQLIGVGSGTVRQSSGAWDPGTCDPLALRPGVLRCLCPSSRAGLWARPASMCRAVEPGGGAGVRPASPELCIPRALCCL